MRIALIEAGSPGLHIYSHVAMGRGVPLLATVVRDAGHEVRAFVEDISGKGSIDWEFVDRADVVGFSAITCTLTRTAELAEEARRRNASAVLVFGGPEPTCAPERAFEAGADYVLLGEAEQTFPLLLGTLQRARSAGMGAADVSDVPGAVWRGANGTLGFGPKPQQLTREAVCGLPLIDMSLVEGSASLTTALVWRSRGCPERCSFCEVHEIWPQYVLRDEETSVEELLACQAGGASNVFLIDDNAAANKPSLKRFLRRAIERGYAGSIAIQLRADAVFDRQGGLDRELLRLLRDVAPMTMVCIGVESSEDSDLEEVGKHLSSDRIAAALTAMRRYGLLVHGMLIAFADDTAQTLRRNGQFARKHLTSLQYLFETPLPGTKSTREHETAGRVLFHQIAQLKFLDGMHVSIRPKNMTVRQMHELVTAEYRTFYSRSRLLRTFVSGVLFRHRRLGPGHWLYLRTLPPMRRAARWAWMHLQFMLAPWAVLRTGRQRVLAVLRDSEYTDYLSTLDG